MLQQAVLEGPHASDTSTPTWDQVVARHSARVYRHALRLTGNRADAEDLTQDVFVRVFRSLETYVPGTFEGWLHRITINLFLDQVRRRARMRTDPAGDALEASVVSSPAAHDLAFDGLFDADVEEALAHLSPEFRAAVLLADVDGLSYEEVAETLGLKLGTVRSRIHRGRSRLRRALAHRAPTGARHRYAGLA
jgi:RNA polymerase sigma factor (sigma-70 family)